MVGAEAVVQVKERADGPVLVVVALGSGQVADKDLGVVGSPEVGEGEAVALACVADLAVDKKLAKGLAEVNPAVQADQLCRSKAGPPVAAQEFVEVLVADVTRVAGEGGLEPITERGELPAEKLEVAGLVAIPDDVTLNDVDGRGPDAGFRTLGAVVPGGAHAGILVPGAGRGRAGCAGY